MELIGFMNRIMPSRDMSSKSTSSVNQSLLTTLPHSQAQSSSSTSSQVSYPPPPPPPAPPPL